MTLSGANSIVEPSPMLGENTKKVLRLQCVEVEHKV